MSLLELQLFVIDNKWFSVVYFFFFGAAIGSFCHFIAYRLANKQSVSETQSRCDHCGMLLQRKLNIPVIGYLLIKGRTTCCNQRLSIQHFLYEVMFGLVLALSIIIQPLNVDMLTATFFWCLASTVLIKINYEKNFTLESKWLLLVCALAIVVLLSSDEGAAFAEIKFLFIAFLIVYIALNFVKHWLDKSHKLDTDCPVLYVVPTVILGDIFLLTMAASFLMPLLTRQHRCIQNIMAWLTTTMLFLR